MGLSCDIRDSEPHGRPSSDLCEVEESTAGKLTRWFKDDEFYHLALLELADWEVHAMPCDRPTVAQVSDLVQRDCSS